MYMHLKEIFVSRQANAGAHIYTHTHTNKHTLLSTRKQRNKLKLNQ